MAMQDVFWFGAGVLVALAAVFVALPLVGYRSDPGRTGRRLLAALGIVGGVGLFAVLLYLAVGSPRAVDAGAPAAGTPAGAMPGTAAASASSMEEAAERLATRLATEGGTPEDWELLARSYEFLGRAGDAAAARRQAGEPAAAPQAVPAMPPLPGTGATGNPPRIEGSVDVSAGLRDRLPAPATLYVYAKQPGATGAPLAVVRLETGAWPARFVLDDSSAMEPGRDLSSAASVLVEARVSASGNATPQPGDLVGSIAPVDPRAAVPVRITLDRIIG